MATILKQTPRGPTVDYTNATGATLASDTLIHLGDQGMVGLVISDIANGSSGPVQLPPFIMSYSVKGHDGSANAAISAYDKIYHTSGETFADVDTSATFIGYTLGGVASGATETEDVLVMPAIA